MERKGKTLPEMTAEEFTSLEAFRLIAELNQTSPATPQYGLIMENIERFSALAMTFPDIWRMFNENVDAPEKRDPPKFEVITGEEPAADEEPEEKPVRKPRASRAKKPKEEEPPVQEEEPEEDVEAPASEYSEADVKKALGKARASGAVPKIKEFLVQYWGVDGFPALPASKYGEVMEKLHKLGAI